MTHFDRLSLAFWATSYDEREARAEIRAQVRAWSDAEPRIEVTRIRRMRRPYPDRKLWWEADVTIARRCAFDDPLTLGLSA